MITCCNFGTNVITMERQVFIPWFAGLFEGEGSFGFNGIRPTRLQIVSTDKDVLERVKLYAGGNVNKASRSGQKEHWKQAYIWALHGESAVKLAEEVLPYLLKRRTMRGKQWLAAYKKQMARAEKWAEEILANIKLMEKYRKEGMTHQKIADKLGFERSHVTKCLKKIQSIMIADLGEIIVFDRRDIPNP